MKLTSRMLVFCSFLFFAAFAIGQQPAFYNDIQNFKKQDSIKFPPQKAILFVGSSSFTKWTDVQQYFPAYKIINRGFGGSTLNDVIRYEKEVIFPYNPKQVVIYCGENDFASSDTVSVNMVVARFKTLFGDIRNKWTDIPLIFVALKPSPSRKKLWTKFQEANQQIQSFLKTKPRTVFLDVYHAMLNEKGEPFPDIFLEDKLHMNAKGYAIWQKLLEPYLLK